MDLEFYLDIASPNAYLASTQVEALAERTGANLIYKPVHAETMYRALYGSPEPPAARESAPRHRMRELDLLRQAELLGQRLVEPTKETKHAVDAMRLIMAASSEYQPRLIRALFQARWVDGEDIGSRSILVRIAEDCGVNVQHLDRAESLRALQDATEIALGKGVFDVPSFRVGDEMWWGVDRLHFVERALGGHPPVVEPTPKGGGQLEFFHDFVSPYAYLAWSTLPQLAAAHRARLICRPVSLTLLLAALGTPGVPMRQMTRPLREYTARDLQAWADLRGTPFQFSTHFPMETDAALRVAYAEPATTSVIYRAAWVDNRDIANPNVLAELIRDAGFDARGVLKRSGEQAAREALISNLERAITLGACGVPTFVVNGRYAFWGQDRLGMVARALDGWAPKADEIL
ncbi:MAG: DsbA family protein [Pseudomonadota bacterium]|nr:DsbA family protein [Pseudomonadota bacterium]